MREMNANENKNFSVFFRDCSNSRRCSNYTRPNSIQPLNSHRYGSMRAFTGDLF